MKRIKDFLWAMVVIILMLITSSCSMGDMRQSAHDAFLNPNTLVPLIGAVVAYAFDEKISDWAIKHHPVYGSLDNAQDAGKFIKNILEIETYATALIPKDRVKRVGIEWATLKAVHASTSFLKQETNRKRPNGTNDMSFPSGCTSKAFSTATLSNRNLDYLDMPRILQVGNICLASGVAWARVEKGAHYPSDVLVGAALGHFLSAFIHDAFLGKNEGFRFSVVPSEDGVMAQIYFNF